MKKGLLITLATSVQAVLASVAFAGPLEDLAATAATKPAVIWYESSPPEQMLKVIEAFNQSWPDIKVQYVRNTGGGGVAAKIIQEAQANAPTASFITADVQQIRPLDERGFVVKPDFASLGIPADLVRSPEAVVVATSLTGLVWNTSSIKPEELPKTWAEVADIRWKGRTGTWVRGTGYASLAASIGEDAARAVVHGIVEQGAMGYSSNAQTAQQTAAGEIDFGVGLYHTTQPVLASGAPVELTFIDPIPTSSIYGTVINTPGGNPEGAQVLLHWLTTLDGANAYERATLRGNPYIEGTHHSDLVKGKTLAQFPFDKADEVRRLDEEFTDLLAKIAK